MKKIKGARKVVITEVSGIFFASVHYKDLILTARYSHSVTESEVLEDLANPKTRKQFK